MFQREKSEFRDPIPASFLFLISFTQRIATHGEVEMRLKMPLEKGSPTGNFILQIENKKKDSFVQCVYRQTFHF